MSVKITESLAPGTINVVTLHVATQDAVDVVQCHGYDFDPREQTLTLYAVIKGRMSVIAIFTRITRVTEMTED